MEDLTYALIGDIGGTNARLQLISYTKDKHQGSTVIREHFYDAQKAKSLHECLADFLTTHVSKEHYPKVATLGLAGPVLEGKCTLSNIPHWPEIDEKELGKEFNISPFRVINDYVAVGYAMAVVKSEDLVVIHEAKRYPKGTMVITGPGTGLGICFITYSEKGDLDVRGTEGGHKNFSPLTQLEWDYHNYILKEHELVRESITYLSTERAMCGPAIPDMYRFFALREGKEVQALKGKEIFERALNKSDDIAVKALEFFLELYGREISNVALSIMPFGGIWLNGNITEDLLDYLVNNKENAFFKGYFGKGKHINNNVLKNFPIYVVKGKEFGLTGAFVKTHDDTKFSS